jgi:chemotaxis protein CheD
MVSTQVLVTMAEIQILKGSGTFTCLGLGSCIGLCILDPVANIGGCAHIMLPESFADKKGERPGKFADTGVPALIQMMERLGAQRSRMVVAMAGGAQVFKYGAGEGQSRLDIGARNSAAVETALKQAGLKLTAKDVGGNMGRTLTYSVETGAISVRVASQGERALCNLRN